MKLSEVQFLFILSLSILSLCQAFYPAPGSYYSVLLRYNNPGKIRKVARIAPSPQRLWAYFNPPSALGALTIEAIDNNIGRYTKNRYLWTTPSPMIYDRGTAGRLAQTPNQRDDLNYQPGQSSLRNNSKLQSQNISNTGVSSSNPITSHKLGQLEESYRKENGAAVNLATKTYRINQKFTGTSDLSTEGIALVAENLTQISPQITEKVEALKTHKRTKSTPKRIPVYQETSMNSHATTSESQEGSCGGSMKISLTPTKSENEKQGRFFQKVIISEGFPKYYKSGKRCDWLLQVSDECQMGMIVYEIQEGNLLQSPQCAMDSLRFVFNGKEQKRICGALKGQVGSYKWTQSGDQQLNVMLNAPPRLRDAVFQKDKKWGFKITLSGYCLVYSANYLSKFVQREFLPNSKLPEKSPPLKTAEEPTQIAFNHPLNEATNDSDVSQIQSDQTMNFFTKTNNNSKLTSIFGGIEGKKHLSTQSENEEALKKVVALLTATVDGQSSTLRSSQSSLWLNDERNSELQSEKFNQTNTEQLISSTEGIGQMMLNGGLDYPETGTDAGMMIIKDSSDGTTVKNYENGSEFDEGEITISYVTVGFMEETEPKGVTSKSVILGE